MQSLLVQLTSLQNTDVLRAMFLTARQSGSYAFKIPRRPRCIPPEALLPNSGSRLRLFGITLFYKLKLCTCGPKIVTVHFLRLKCAIIKPKHQNLFMSNEDVKYRSVPSLLAVKFVFHSSNVAQFLTGSQRLLQTCKRIFIN